MFRESGLAGASRSRVVVVHSFAEQARARLVPGWLADRGYRAVPAGTTPPAGAPVVHLGDLAHALALSRVAAHLRGRIEALAVVGGSLSVLLDGSDGLRIPALVVQDDVNRMARRRALRRLPRGSQVIRARDFEIALLAAMDFFEKRVGEAYGTRRSLAARIAPAVVLTAPAAALFAGSGVGLADAVCTSSFDNGEITVSCDGDDGANLKIWASTEGDVYVDDTKLAPLGDVSLITVTMPGGDDALLIDESQHKLQTLLKIDLGDGVDTLSWTATADGDAFKLATETIDASGVQQKVLGAETIKFDLGAGDDLVDGGDWSSKLVLDGGQGTDVLIGGAGPDLFTLSPGQDTLDGGAGLDRLKIVSATSLITIDGTSVTLDESASSYKQFEALDVLGGGENTLKISGDDPLVTLSDSLVKLTDSSITYQDFALLSYVGGDGEGRFDLSGLDAQKVALDGGGGLDEIKLSTDAGFVGISDSLLKFSATEVALAGLESLSYLGGPSANTIEAADLQKLKVTLDGGGGDDLLKIASDDSLIQISDSLVELTDAGVGLAFTDFEVVGVDGGTSANKIDVKLADFLNKLKLEVDGGAGVDDLKLKYDSEIKMTSSTIDLVDKLVSITYANTESFELVGGDASSKIDILGTSFLKLALDGGGGDDLLKIASDDSLIQITDSKLSLADSQIDHKSFETIAALGGDSANKIDAALVTELKVDLDGGAGNDVLIGGARDDKLTGGLGNDNLTGNGGIDLVYAQGDVDFTATNTTLTGLGVDSLATVERLHLDGGSKDNILDASSFKLGSVTLDGGASDDVLIGSPGNDMLLGGIGDDRLVGNQGDDSLFAGDGDDALYGSQGTDFGDGGAGIDTGKSIETRINIEG